MKSSFPNGPLCPARHGAGHSEAWSLIGAGPGLAVAGTGVIMAIGGLQSVPVGPAYRVKGKAGKPTTNNAIYGYKERLNTSLNTLRPALTQYNQLAKDIRDKTKDRRSLLSEKKALSAVHVFRHRELAAKIAVLTEDLEELRSEKNLLLASLAYTEEDAAEQFPKDIAAMEQSLKRLEEQEQKYSAELDAALNEYVGLREQAQGFDPVQLYKTKQAIRPSKEQEAENRAQQVYGEKYSSLLMFDSKKAVSRMLHEDIERQVVRRMMRQAQKEQQTLPVQQPRPRHGGLGLSAGNEIGHGRHGRAAVLRGDFLPVKQGQGHIPAEKFRLVPVIQTSDDIQNVPVIRMDAVAPALHRQAGGQRPGIRHSRSPRAARRASACSTAASAR
ncbi:hypothetical protein MR578_08595 [bacterium]|nr:hypothetical protein [bacterium]